MMMVLSSTNRVFLVDAQGFGRENPGVEGRAIGLLEMHFGMKLNNNPRSVTRGYFLCRAADV